MNAIQGIRPAQGAARSRRPAAGFLVAFGGQAGAQALGFVRNLIVARLVSAADFGICATFAMTVALLNMLGDLSVDKLLVQAKDGDSPRVQATAQLIQFARGVVGALLLFAVGGLVADAFDAPQAAWAFRTLAFVPLIRGCAHLDIRRVQRDLRFAPAAVADGVPQLVSTLAAWPLAVWLGDYRVVLWAVLLQEALATVLSHALAERRYAWAADRVVARRIAAFGLPLCVNALLMFGIFQGDRVVVGAAYGLELLGAYSTAFMLTIVPTALLAGVSTSLALPVLSRAQDDPREFERRTAATTQTIALVAALVAVPLAVLGGRLVVALYGAKYAAAAAVVPWLAAMQCVRMLRVGPTLAAIAQGDTVNSMIGNVWRSGALAAMAVAALLQADLTWVAAAGLGGEIAALLYSCARLARRQRVPWSATLAPSVPAFVGACAALAFAALAPAWGLPSSIAAAVLLEAATLAWLLTAFPELKTTLRELALGRGAARPLPTP
jgi:O-antigen/teichoic acid export membrane protein